MVSYIREGSIIIWVTLEGANTSLSHHYDHFEEQCSAGGIRSIRLQTIWVTISAIWHHTGHKGGLLAYPWMHSNKASQSKWNLGAKLKNIDQIYGNFGGRKAKTNFLKSTLTLLDMVIVDLLWFGEIWSRLICHDLVRFGQKIGSPLPPLHGLRRDSPE